MAIRGFLDRFIEVARPIVQTIIKERLDQAQKPIYAPVSNGCLMPSPSHNVLSFSLSPAQALGVMCAASKMSTYEAQGMLFQIPTDANGGLSAAEEDLKRDRFYLKAYNALLSSGLPRVALPITCFINYLVYFPSPHLSACPSSRLY